MEDPSLMRGHLTGGRKYHPPAPPEAKHCDDSALLPCAWTRLQRQIASYALCGRMVPHSSIYMATYPPPTSVTAGNRKICSYDI